ncbi:MAG: potassium/proton antiporter [Nocardioides sp.]
MSIHELDLFLLVGSTVTLCAILAVRLTSVAGLPSLLVYLLMGVALGEAGLGIHFDNAEMAHSLGFAALALILAEGGVTTSWRVLRPSMRLGLSLATIGVAVSVGVMALGAHYLLGLPWELAVLLGAVTSPTDAAAVFSVLRVVPLPRRLTGALEAESGLNDAPTVVLVSLISAGTVHDHPWWVVLAIVAGELALGVLIGVAVGAAGAWLLRRVSLPTSGLYSISVLALCFLADGGAAVLHGSGFAAIYVAAVVLGNAELPHRQVTRGFAEGVAWLAQIGLFVMLGLLLSPETLTWDIVVRALVAGLVLTFVARPLAVLVAMIVQPLGLRDAIFLSWAGLRGAVPVVLMTIPLADGVPGSLHLFDLVFVLVVVYTLVTAPTLPGIAKLLGLVQPRDARAFELEVAVLERVAADLLQITITPASLLHGVEVGELRLPRGASVSMVIREGESIPAEPRTVLRRGDDMLVVVPRALREKAERRLRQVSRHGRLAGWVGRI